MGVQLKGESKPIQAKKYYDGKGNQELKNQLRNKFGKLTPNLKKLFSEIENADDEYSGVIADYYKNNPQVELKLGKNLDSEYVTKTIYNVYSRKSEKVMEIHIGDGLFSDNQNYSKGGVFFHESGHGLDATYVSKIGDRGVWSYDYKSKEFKKSLDEMIKEELDQFNDVDKFNELKKMANNTDEIFDKEWSKYKEEYDDLIEKDNAFYKSIINEPSIAKYTTDINAISKEILKLQEKFNKRSSSASFDELLPIRTSLQEKQKELYESTKKKAEAIDKFTKEKFPERANERKRFLELGDLKFKLEQESKSKVNIPYGDLSDMVQSVTGKTLTGMGHEAGYFDKLGKRGKEAFAEIMSAKATNPESLKILEKYIPNSLKIFDEIMGEIRK